MHKLLFISLIAILLKINIVFSTVNLEIKSTPNFKLKSSVVTKKENDKKVRSLLSYSDHTTQAVFDDYFTCWTEIKLVEENHLCGHLQTSWRESNLPKILGLFHLVSDYYLLSQHPQCEKIEIMLHIHDNNDKPEERPEILMNHQLNTLKTTHHPALNTNYMIRIFEKEESEEESEEKILDIK